MMTTLELQAFVRGNLEKVVNNPKLSDVLFVVGSHADDHDTHEGIAKYYGKGTVKEQKVCEATFELVLPDEVNKFKIIK